MSMQAPGVYVKEVPTGPRAIGAVGTSTAAFVGRAPLAAAHPNEAVPCNNWSRFVREFVGKESPSTELSRAVFGFFMNGGGRCYVVNTGDEPSIAGDARKRSGLVRLEAIDEIAIVAAPGFADPAAYDALLTHCERLEDRVAILDAPASVANVDALKQVATVGAPGGTETEEREETALRPRNSNGGYGAFYFPWIRIRDPLDGRIVEAPPSGHLAGIYARTDATRGVHKAPANEEIRGALGLAYRVTREEQGELNRAGVNCIRYFTNAGIRVWGARTLAPEAGEWRYVNVRRLFNMIKESIAEGTSWTVFEPNDATLWQAVTRDVSAFLKTVWLDGALMGASPDQAFYVKCDAETNPPEVIDQGRLIVEVGIAPVKPAEFITFRIGQWAGGAETETGGGGGAEEG
jgi:phage tail sheath protein FI